MKKLVLAAAIAGFATAGFAGSIDAPTMESVVVIEDATTAAASSSSTGLILPLLALAAIVAVVAN
ncbi:MAG: hypothetical protein ACPGVS_00970 [Primorskyibacter sp.]